MRYTILVTLLMASLVTLPAEAQRKAGRTGAAFLEIGVGAREVGMGSAVSSMANDANQVFWNPAGTALASDQKFSAAFSYSSWIADIDHSAFAVGYNLGNAGTITVGAQVLGLTDIPANRQNGYTDPDLVTLIEDTETAATFDFIDVAVSVSYARYFIDKLALGATFKVINESIDGISASAVAFDFGSVYNIGISGWQLAARISNLGSDMEFFTQDNPLPLSFSIGTSIYPVNTENTRLMLAVDTIKPLDSQQLLYGGAELSFYDLLFLRGGYKFNYSGADDGGTSDRDAVNASIEGVSLGGGLQYEISGYAIAIDYAFTQMDLLDNVNRISLRIGR